MRVNIHDQPPFIANKDNYVVSRTGDLTFCYEFLLPEKHSLSEKGYDKFLETLERAFKPFESNVVIHKTDFFMTRPYDDNHLHEKSYLQRTFKTHHAKKKVRVHQSYLFFTWTLSDLINKDEFSNPFSKLSNEKEIIEMVNDSAFPDTVDTQVAYVNSSKRFKLRKLDSGDIEKLCRTYFNGLLQSFYTDIDGTAAGNKKIGLKVGERTADIFTVNSVKQLPTKFSNVIQDPELSDQGRNFYQGITEPLGLGLPFDHIVNQIIYLPSHSKLLAQLQSKQKEFFGSRGFGLNSKPADNIQNYLLKVSDSGTTRLVKCHFNLILFTDSDKERREARNAVSSTFTENDITPYMPTGNALRGLFLNSFFAFSSRIPARFKFITELDIASALFIPTTTYRDHREGVYFCDRISTAPLRRDTWDEKKVNIKARNFFIIAPTGQGKSILCNQLCYQYLDQGYKLVINDLGKSYQNLYRLYKDRSAMLDFKIGQSLGINPFHVEDPNQVDSSKIQYLNDIINLFHFKGAIARDSIDSAHDTCLRKIIEAFYQTSDDFDLKTFYQFFNYIHKQKRYDDIGIDASVYDPYKSMGEVIFSLSEFNDGIYSYLFEEPKSDKDLFRITPDTDFAYFEFDAASDDPLLSSILQLYAFEATKNVIWENKDVKGVQIYDEYAKQIKNPQIQATSEYIAQAIRKQNGACGFVIQSVTQLPKNDTIGSILDNTSVFYILPTEKTHKETAERLHLPEHQHYLLDSIESNLSGTYPYTEIFLLIGKYANVVRNQLPPEHVIAFQTEGELYNTIESLYKEYQDMPRVIEELIKRQNSAA